MLDLCFVLEYFVSFLVLQSSRWERERAACFTFVVLFDFSSWCHRLVCSV